MSKTLRELRSARMSRHIGKATHDKVNDVFQDVWTVESKRMILNILKSCLRELRERDVDVYLFCGALLGACRNGSLIPWDGDIDLFVSTQDEAKVRSALQSLKAGGLKVVDWGRWDHKIFHPDGSLTSRDFLWPWLDVGYFDTTEGMFNALHSTGGAFYSCPLERAIPADQCELEGMSIPCLKDPEWHLDRFYPRWKTVAASSLVNHRTAEVRKADEYMEIEL